MGCYHSIEETFVLVCWEEEDSVSVVLRTRIEGDLKIGEMCKMEIHVLGKMYSGKLLLVHVSSHSLCTALNSLLQSYMHMYLHVHTCTQVFLF